MSKFTFSKMTKMLLILKNLRGNSNFSISNSRCSQRIQESFGINTKKLLFSLEVPSTIFCFYFRCIFCYFFCCITFFLSLFLLHVLSLVHFHFIVLISLRICSTSTFNFCVQFLSP